MENYEKEKDKTSYESTIFANFICVMSKDPKHKGMLSFTKYITFTSMKIITI